MKSHRIVLYFPALKKAAIRPPWSLVALVPPLVEAGYEPEIIDGRLFDDEHKKIHHILDRIGDDVLFFGVSAITGHQIRDALHMLRVVKRFRPQTTTVWGGWHATLQPIKTCENELVDIVVKGQGEVTVVELADALRTGSNLKDVKGIVFKAGGSPASTETRKPMDIDYAYHLFDSYIHFDKYYAYQKLLTYDNQLLTVKVGNVHTSFGCPFNCTFCPISIAKKRVSFRSMNKVLDDIEYLRNIGFDFIEIDDSNFLIQEDRVIQFCEGLTARKIQIHYSIKGRSEIIMRLSEKTISSLAATGCVRVMIGAESGSDRVLKLLRKGTTVATMLAAVQRLDRCGIYTNVSFMGAIPGETHEEFKLTINTLLTVARIAKPPLVNQIPFYCPVPGGELYDQTISLGFKPPQELEAWSEFDFSSWVDNIDARPWIPRPIQEEMIRVIDGANRLLRINDILATARHRFQGRKALFLSAICWPFARLLLAAASYKSLKHTTTHKFLRGLLYVTNQLFGDEHAYV